MGILSAVFGVACICYLVSRLVNRIAELEKRIAWLEDRSPQARYVRELEDKEKEWPQATDDLKELVGHILIENFAHSAAIRTILVNQPKMMDALAGFSNLLPTNNEADIARIGAIRKILKPLEH